MTLIKIECNGKVKYCVDVEFKNEVTNNLINNGHDDLFDLGFTIEDLKDKNLKLSIKHFTDEELYGMNING